MTNTQLTKVSGYNVNNMIFSEPQENKIPNSTFSYKRINISTRNNNGTIGDLVLQTPTLFSFGVQENINPETQEVNGYIMPLCMWTKGGCTDEEKEWTDTFNKICEHCKEHLIEHRTEFGKWDLEMNDLKKFNPLYWKRDKRTGLVENGTGPTLYPKLIMSKKLDKIMSVFFDKFTGDDIDPLSILGKMCNVTAAVKIESIFIGNKISLQVKLWETEVELKSVGVKRLLQVNRPEETNDNNDDEHEVQLVNEETTGSINELSDDEFISKPKVQRKRVAKK